MIQHVPEKRSTGLINWKLAAIMGNMMPPPRDPDEEDEDEDEEDEQDGADEPALVREPDEDCLAADDQEAESERGKPPAGKQACP
jgi:hypothetical protein